MVSPISKAATSRLLEPSFRTVFPFKARNSAETPRASSNCCHSQPQRAATSQGKQDPFLAEALKRVANTFIVLTATVLACQPAAAVLNSPNASVARSVDAALRRSIPASNLDMKSVQRSLEDIAFKLRIPQRKPWQQMSDDIIKATKIMYDSNKVLAGVPSTEIGRAQGLAENIRAGLVRVNAAIDAKDADKVSIRVADVLRSVADLELIQAPGLSFSIPRLYQDLPRLTGRATVEITFERKGSGEGYVDKGGGGDKPQGQIVVEIDGYSAPITAGNFVVSILAGDYNGARITTGGETISVSSNTLQGKVLPMEMFPLGEFEPVYRTPLDVQNGELPMLPLSIYGALAMAHPASDAGEGLAAANEFFFYKFDRSSSGLAGLSFEEGLFPVFGYVTQGSEILSQLHSGDIIADARLVSGAEKLVRP